MYSNKRIEAMLTPEMIEQLGPEAKRLAKKIEQAIRLEMETKSKNLTNNKNMDKSKKSKSEITKNGISYVIIRNLPEDQQQALAKMNTRYTCPILEEAENIPTLFYHDYENFYNNWIKGKEAFHLD